MKLTLSSYWASSTNILWLLLTLTLLPSLTLGQPNLQEQTMIPSGADWRYLDDGSDQSVIWQLSAYDDDNWNSGPAPLGYGNGDEATEVSFGSNSQQKHITTYFRHSFEIADPTQYQKLVLQLRRDDGAVIFLNGSEVFRSNLPLCDITYTTTAAAAVENTEESLFFPHTIISPGLLQTGNNLLAVEVHQSSASSDDLSFDLELIGHSTVANLAPTITLTDPAPRNQRYCWYHGRVKRNRSRCRW